jgi:20S proteasome subunit beta 1
LAGVIVAGYDEVDGGSVYVIPLGGTCLKAPFAIGGSGSTYIYGHVDHEFKPGMSLAECKAFVAEAIKRAMARDGSSGGIVRLVCINAEGVEREYLTV